MRAWLTLSVLLLAMTASAQTQTRTVVDPTMGISITTTTTTVVTKTCPVITVTLPTATPRVGAAYAQLLTSTGGTAPYTYAVTVGATLPTGLMLSTSGLLNGLPTAAGSFTIAATVTDSQACRGTLTATLTITPVVVTCPTLTLSPLANSTARIGVAFSQTLATSGGASPYVYALTAGTLPVGLTLTTAGAITGTPTTSSSSAFTIRATDSKACTGSLAYTVTVTSTAVVVISPGASIQTAVAASPSPSSFLIKAGVHRLQSISPRTGDTFMGEPGTVLSGARLLTTFTRSGALWVAGGQTQQGTVHGICEVGYEGCSFPEELFINDALLTHVTTLAAVVPGAWFFDYAADTIYFADDPTGKTVEASITAEAFRPTGNNVTVNGLIVEKYASGAQYGPINAENVSGWTVSNNEVRWNHGGGIRVGPNSRILTNHVHHNSQLGIGGVGDDVLVDGNEIDHNNTAHFEIEWEAGGTKFTNTDRLIVINTIHTLYDTNRVEDNFWAGILHEISFDAVISNNTVRRNGFGKPVWAWAAGILVSASTNVEVYGNTLEDNAGGITGAEQNRPDSPSPFGPHIVTNLYVHDNMIRQSLGWTGVACDNGDATIYTAARGNRFLRNMYTGSPRFTWNNVGDMTQTQWQAVGQQ